MVYSERIIKTIKMSLDERRDISLKHNPRVVGPSGRSYCSLTNEQVDQIILEVYGLRKLSFDPLDLTFVVEDDKKYMMYLLRGLE